MNKYESLKKLILECLPSILIAGAIKSMMNILNEVKSNESFKSIIENDIFIGINILQE